MERMPAEDLISHEVVDTMAKERAEAKTKGYPMPSANWVCHFIYTYSIKTVWTTERGQVYHWATKKREV